MPRLRRRPLGQRKCFLAASVLAGSLVCVFLLVSPGHGAEATASGAKDPLKIVISLSKQKLYAYRGTTRVFTSRVSTGRRGYSTPAGIYSILEKRRWHRSNIYSGAPMPFMQRLTWSGIALHAGYVPNYPASHGCVRLPQQFAQQLFQETKVGSHVIVTREETEPHPIAHPNLLQPRPLELVTMDAEKALSQRLAFTQGKYVSIALPVRADRGKRYAALTSPPDMLTASDALPEAPARVMTAREAALHIADVEYDVARLEQYVQRSEKPLRILITWRKGGQSIRETQRLLEKIGYDPGPIDGLMGRETSSAIQAFQKAKGLEETGAFSKELLDALYAAAGEEKPPAGHLYVRQDFKEVFNAPVHLADPDKPLGTHIYFALDFQQLSTHAEWLAITTDEVEGSDAAQALDRIRLPEEVRARLERMLTPGSSLIVSDSGFGRETGRGTDFIVLNH